MKYLNIKDFIRVLYSKTYCSLRKDKRFSSDLRFNSMIHVSVMLALNIIPLVSILAILLHRAGFFSEEIFTWMKGGVVLLLIGIPVLVWRITNFSGHEAQRIWNDTPTGIYKGFVNNYSWLVMSFLILTITLAVTIGDRPRF